MDESAHRWWLFVLPLLLGAAAVGTAWRGCTSSRRSSDSFQDIAAKALSDCCPDAHGVDPAPGIVRHQNSLRCQWDFEVVMAWSDYLAWLRPRMVAYTKATESNDEVVFLRTVANDAVEVDVQRRDDLGGRQRVRLVVISRPD